jgi:hypothetical protein
MSGVRGANRQAEMPASVRVAGKGRRKESSFYYARRQSRGKRKGKNSQFAQNLLASGRVFASGTSMTLAELESLVEQFESCTLPRELWTHRAHLAVAVWYLFHFSRDEATERLRTGIQRYNSSLGNTQGYHETITLCWIAILTAHMREPVAGLSVADIARNVLSSYGASDFLLAHFSKERLFSELARREWVEPDLRPLDS